MDRPCPSAELVITVTGSQPDRFPYVKLHENVMCERKVVTKLGQ
jgi:hypothetical protein